MGGRPAPPLPPAVKFGLFQRNCRPAQDEKMAPLKKGRNLTAEAQRPQRNAEIVQKKYQRISLRPLQSKDLCTFACKGLRGEKEFFQ